MNEEIEPNQYFEDLKSKLKSSELDQLKNNRMFLMKEMEKAHKLGQKNLTHKSVFMWEMLEKEMILHSIGIRDYVHRDDIIKLIDNVKPKNSVKIVELENFPRSVPDKNMEEIEKAISLELFDVILVVYTDLTNEEVITPEQKEFVRRNTDPIVFGMFLNDKLNLRHDRLYHITNWEDEYCDLTFSKMIDKMSEIGIEKPRKVIMINHDHINSIVAQTKKEVEEINLKNNHIIKTPHKKSFVSSILSRFGL